MTVAAISVLFTSCSNSAPKASSTTSTTTSAETQIALFGDSLAWEAQPYWIELARQLKDGPHTYDSFGGTAICDWLTRMSEVEAQYHPSAVQLQFSGNNLSPCMDGYKLYSSRYYEKYKSDALAAIKIFTTGRAHVFLVGAPITRSDQSVPDWQRLNQLYQQIAAADPEHVTDVDAGAAVEGPGHTYTDTLPCLKDEPCTGPVVDGVHTNIVRSPDGTHFCPVEEGDEAGVVGKCPVYSSGAYRYAKAMIDALMTPKSSDH